VRTEARLKETSGWLQGLESALENTGARGAETARYLRDYSVRIVLRQQSAGARWTIDRRIEIHPRYAQGPGISPYGLSLVIHEVRHLQQGLCTALSVYGEMDAWRVQFGFLSELSVEVPGSESQRASIRQLLALPFGCDRVDLSTARRLMRDYGGRAYRVDLLPLYPVRWEIAYLITGRVPARF
jgi:hypothetical protein